MTIKEAKTKSYPDGGGKYLIGGKTMVVHCDEYHMHSFKCLIEVTKDSAMKPREEILQNLKTHLKECKQEFELCTDEAEDATIEEIELSARIDTLKWAIELFGE